MRTRQRHTVQPATVEALLQARNGATWRGLANRLGYPDSYAATLQKVANGRTGVVTRDGENDLRAKLGLPQIILYEEAPCPDCGGEPHLARCHGKRVAGVVVLAEGERVAKRSERTNRKRNTAGISVQGNTRKRLDAVRRASGLTWDAFLLRLLEGEDHEGITE